MTDLPSLPKVQVVAPNYFMANLWAKEHGVPRRRMRVVTTQDDVSGLRGTVYLSWPPYLPDPNWILEQVKMLAEDGIVTYGDCTALRGLGWDEQTGTSSEAASLPSPSAG